MATATADAVDASAPKGKGKKKLIIIVVALLLVLGLGGGAAVFMMKKKASAEAEGDEPAAAHAAPTGPDTDAPMAGAMSPGSVPAQHPPPHASWHSATVANSPSSAGTHDPSTQSYRPCGGSAPPHAASAVGSSG